MKTYELRDPIYKRIAFSEVERRLIDHPFFQRLRFISQLSFLQAFVYPGATHDRFTHSIGSMHVARRLIGRCLSASDFLRSTLSLEEQQELTKRVMTAGLLHDIGHGPFSHSSEQLFPPLRDLPLEASWWKEIQDRRSEHEDYSVLFIQTLVQEGVLESGFAQDVASLIHGDVCPGPFFLSLEQRLPTIQSVMKTLISGVADCDRMDYLLRDSYYCGVAYGQYDIDWIISNLGIAKQDGRLIRTVTENGVRALEDFLLARYHMIDQVYHHKTKAGFAHYLEQAVAQKEIEMTIPADPYAYADMRDGQVLEKLCEAAKDPAHYYAHHLMRRLPPRRILRLHDRKPEDRETLAKLQRLCEREHIRSFTYPHHLSLSQKTQSASDIYVEKKTLEGVSYVSVFAYSDLLKNYNEMLSFSDFYVYREDMEKFETKKQ
jgi:HD superfamily phosphohydrolase